MLLDAGTDPQWIDVQVRDPVDDEVLVRIDAAGICHTDLSLAARWPAKRTPMVFGHEGQAPSRSSGRGPTSTSDNPSC